MLSGKDIGTVSFYPTENEVLLGPSHKFLVTSETGGYQEGGYTMVELMQQSLRAHRLRDGRHWSCRWA